MKHAFSRLVAGILTLALLISLTPLTLADASVAGRLIDEIIPINEKVFTESYTLMFDSKDMTISTDPFTTESGFIDFDFDKTQIQMAGAESYRTYAFTNDFYYTLAVAFLCSAVETCKGLDYGIQLNWIEDGQTEVMTQEDIHEISLEFTEFFESIQ